MIPGFQLEQVDREVAWEELRRSGFGGGNYCSILDGVSVRDPSGGD